MESVNVGLGPGCKARKPSPVPSMVLELCSLPTCPLYLRGLSFALSKLVSSELCCCFYCTWPRASAGGGLRMAPRASFLQPEVTNHSLLLLSFPEGTRKGLIQA